jgi:hypothetical protein
MPTLSRRSSRARTVGTVLAWLLAAATATLVGVVAVGAIGSGIVPPSGGLLSPSEVSARLAETPGSAAPNPTTTAAGPAAPTPSTPSRTTHTPGVPTPTSTPVPTSVAAATPRVLGSPGGTVLARCGPAVEVVSAIPAQGYDLKDIEPHEGRWRVRFETGRTRVEVLVSCVDGQPRASVGRDDH